MTLVYIRLKKKINTNVHDVIKLKELAYISTKNIDKKKKIEDEVIYRIKEDDHVIVVDSFIIIKHLNEKYDDVEFQLLGPTETLIQVNKEKKQPQFLYFLFIWLLLFIGTAMTIMNFHYDVSMQEVQQKIHLLLTGKEEEFPLWIQIPYSLGLGLGMVLYLNHWFKKRINKDPSPLEIELHQYQLDIDNYARHYENKLNDETR